MKTSGFVEDDGYLRTDYLAGDAMLAPLRFRYRPTIPEELMRYQRGAKNLQDEKLVEYAAAWGAGRLTDWTLEDRRGNPVTITPHALRRLEQRRFYQLLAVILGDQAGDPDPDWTVEQAEQEWADRAAAAAAKQTLAQYRAERDAKNSQPG